MIKFWYSCSSFNNKWCFFLLFVEKQHLVCDSTFSSVVKISTDIQDIPLFLSLNKWFFALEYKSLDVPLYIIVKSSCILGNFLFFGIFSKSLSFVNLIHSQKCNLSLGVFRESNSSNPKFLNISSNSLIFFIFNCNSFENSSSDSSHEELS